MPHPWFPLSFAKSNACARHPMWPLLLAALGCSLSVSAGPTVGQLLAACDRGAAQGQRGVDAALCEWYAAPCACKPGATDVARWCVPSAEPVERIAAQVVARLRTSGDRSAAVDQVVPEILARIYPCASAQGRRPQDGQPTDN